MVRLTLRVAQDLHGHSGVDVEVCQEYAAASAAVVDGDLPDAGFGAANVPGAVEVARFDGCAVAGGEHQLVASRRSWMRHRARSGGMCVSLEVAVSRVRCCTSLLYRTTSAILYKPGGFRVVTLREVRSDLVAAPRSESTADFIFGEPRSISRGEIQE